MSNREKTRIAYRCPYCGAVLTFDLSKDRLNSGKFSVPCIQCHKSHLEIALLPGDTVSLTVPCLMCPHPHPFKMSAEMFFTKDIYNFPCSFTGLDICFIGEEDLVEDEIDASGALINSMLEETREEDANAKDADVMVADTGVMREVLFAIGKLDEEKKIKCKCGSGAVKVLLDYDKAVVICKVCANKTDIPARTRFDANDAIDMEEINF